jgi:quercetin dioxygenase-like cupin family protein
MSRAELAAILGILGCLGMPTTSRTAVAQDAVNASHTHLSGVSCDDVPPNTRRPDFGCFNVASEADLHFPQAEVYWHIRTFADRAAADAAKSPTGIVVEEDGRVWLSEFGSRELIVKGGQAVATVGPLQLPPAKSFTAVLSYAVMRPGDQSRVHTHPGPEGWYMIAGEQCLETPAGAIRAKTGETATVPPNVPMQLSITGTEVRKSLVLVLHDSSQARGIPSQWTPPGACHH